MTKKNRDADSLRVVVIQMNSSDDRTANFKQIQDVLAPLDMNAVDVVLFPEVFNVRSRTNHEEDASECIETGVTIQWIKALAIQYGVYILAGSMMESTGSFKSYNTSLVVDPQGEVMGMYRKIHLFDVDVNGQSIHESNRFLPGKQPTMVTIMGWKIGLSICYDLRFPELYRHYFYNEADVLVLPSSFTYHTGRKHWEILCRARAIENQCYVLAPNQCGMGARHVQTYGNSLAIGPDGDVLDRMNDKDVGCFQVTLSKGVINQIRTAMPTRPHGVLLNQQLI